MLQYNYPIVGELYNTDFFIDGDILEEMLALGDKVTADLVRILDGLLQSPQSHTQDREWFESFYLSHAFYLLVELKAKKAFPIVLEMAKLDFEDLDFVFGEGLHDDFAEAVVKLGKDNLDELLAFLAHPKTTLSQKDILVKGVCQMALFYTDKRTKIINFFESHLQSFIKEPQKADQLFGDDSNNLSSNAYLAYLIGSLLDIDAQELEKSIFKCYELGLVDEDILALEDVSFEQVQLIFFESIFDRYADLKTSQIAETSPYNPEAEEIARRKAKYLKDEEEEKIWKKLIQADDDKTQQVIKKKKIFRE